jgi:hypothetical protein
MAVRPQAFRPAGGAEFYAGLVEPDKIKEASLFSSDCPTPSRYQGTNLSATLLDTKRGLARVNLRGPNAPPSKEGGVHGKPQRFKRGGGENTSAIH